MLPREESRLHCSGGFSHEVSLKSSEVRSKFKRKSLEISRIFGKEFT